MFIFYEKMKIQKTVQATLTLDNHEVLLLQKYMDWARIYFEQIKHKPAILEAQGYQNPTDARVDMARVMEPIFEL